MTTGQHLKLIRKKTNLSQEKFAHSLGVSLRAVYNWEKGEALPSAINLKKIRELYNVDINEVLSCN